MSSSFGSIFYTLTGLHGLHVFIGLIVLFRLFPSFFRFFSTKFLSVQLKLSYLYIHIVDGVWVILIIFVYMPI